MDADTASNNFPVRKDKHWSTGVKVASEVQPLPIGGEGFSSKTLFPWALAPISGDRELFACSVLIDFFSISGCESVL